MTTAAPEAAQVLSPEELELIREHVPFFTAEDQEWILGRTALTLWHFGQRQ